MSKLRNPSEDSNTEEIDTYTFYEPLEHCAIICPGPPLKCILKLYEVGRKSLAEAAKFA